MTSVEFDTYYVVSGVNIEKGCLRLLSRKKEIFIAAKFNDSGVMTDKPIVAGNLRSLGKRINTSPNGCNVSIKFPQHVSGLIFQHRYNTFDIQPIDNKSDASFWDGITKTDNC